MLKILLMTGFTLISQVAHSQTRCQCTYQNWVGDCTATIELKENWFKITSDTEQCSRVDWYTDGTPQLTIVTDGVETVEWQGQNSKPEFMIDSCKICRDSNIQSNAGQQAVDEKGLSGDWTITWLQNGSRNQMNLLQQKSMISGNYTNDLGESCPVSGNYFESERKIDLKISCSSWSITMLGQAGVDGNLIHGSFFAYNKVKGRFNLRRQ